MNLAKVMHAIENFWFIIKISVLKQVKIFWSDEIQFLPQKLLVKRLLFLGTCVSNDNVHVNLWWCKSDFRPWYQYYSLKNLVWDQLLKNTWDQYWVLSRISRYFPDSFMALHVLMCKCISVQYWTFQCIVLCT